MGFMKKIAGIFGLSKEETHEVNDDEDAEDAGDHHHRRHHPHHHHHNRHNYGENEERHRPTKGFSVQVPVTVEKPQLGPVITPSFGNGGVQGLRWYAKRLKIDEDGDVADEFLDEVLLEASSSMDAQKSLPRFEVKYNTRQVKVKNQMIARDGKLEHIVEYEGRTLLV